MVGARTDRLIRSLEIVSRIEQSTLCTDTRVWYGIPGSQGTRVLRYLAS